MIFSFHFSSMCEVFCGVVVNKYNACCRSMAFPAREGPETIKCWFMAAVKTGHEQGLLCHEVSQVLICSMTCKTLPCHSLFLFFISKDEDSFRRRGRSGLYFHITTTQEPGTKLVPTHCSFSLFE